MLESWEWVKSFIDEISSSPYLGLAGVVLSAFSIFYALYVRNKSKKKEKVKYLRCHILSNNVIRDKERVFPKLNIEYDGLDF
jgi:hypothetical protein